MAVVKHLQLPRHTAPQGCERKIGFRGMGSHEGEDASATRSAEEPVSGHPGMRAVHPFQALYTWCAFNGQTGCEFRHMNFWLS